MGLTLSAPHMTLSCPGLDRGIQYVAASLVYRRRLGALDRPIKSGDDTECVVRAP